MYLFSELRILPLLLLFLLWGAGGWLMTLRWFDLESHERGFIGLGMGMILANWTGNLLARVLPMSIVFWVSGILVFALGIAAALPLPLAVLRAQLKGWGSRWLFFAGLVLLFTLIGRGLGLFDDKINLPTTSMMATGDIPPHVAGAPDVRYGYHYFLLLLGVQFMRVAGASPWTALDLARGLTLALAIVLTGLLAWRLTRSKGVVWLSATFFAFAGGTRWLLLLLPAGLLQRISATIKLIGSGRDTAPNFFEALSRPWQAVGSGPLPFPFAFGNGVNDPSIMAHYGYGVSSGLVLLVLILLASRQQDWKAGIPLTILLASLALANEVDFVLLYIGILFAAVLWLIWNKTLRLPASARFWIPIVILAGIIAVTQGGLLTEILWGRLQPVSAASSYFTVNFSLTSPAVIAAHLGRLSLLNPYQLLAALFEVGPVVLVLPLVLIWGYRALREEKWLHAAVAASTMPSLLSVFVEYSGNADVTATTRLLFNLLLVCKIFGIPLLWLWLRIQDGWKQSIASGLAAMSMLSGVVFFAFELIAVPRPVYAPFLTDMDAQFYRSYWDRLSPPSAWVLDTEPSRASTIFGRQSHALIDWGTYTPEYLALLENPDPYRWNAAGYRFFYAEKEYWNKHKEQLDQPCVRVLRTVAGARQAHGGFAPDFRRLADISGCK
jgi:hypothetical protein